jgi:hypothetical protein
VAHSLLPQADAKAACGRSVIPRLSGLTASHLEATEREPPPAMTSYSASAANSGHNLTRVHNATFRATELKSPA